MKVFRNETAVSMSIPFDEMAYEPSEGQWIGLYTKNLISQAILDLKMERNVKTSFFPILDANVLNHY